MALASQQDGCAELPGPLLILQKIRAYYRRYVPSFADVARPLHVLTEERSPFLWTNSCQQAFEALKTALTQTQILVLPTVDDDFYWTRMPAASGSELYSRTNDGKEQVIAFFSQALSKPERNYCVTRKELPAPVKTVHHFHHYLCGRQFMVRTDHSALQWLMKFRTPEGEIARWLQKLQDYDFKVLHGAGRKHGNADAMSRRPCPEDCKNCTRAEEKQDHSNECRVRRITLKPDERSNRSPEDLQPNERQVQRTTLKPDERSNRSPEDLQREQRNDHSLGIIINWLEARPVRPSWREVSSKSGGEEILEALGFTEHPRRSPDVPLGDSQPR